jgi:hypothetical protein
MAAQSSPRPIADRETFLNAGKNEASTPAVAWAAVIGGALWANNRLEAERSEPGS